MKYIYKKNVTETNLFHVIIRKIAYDEKENGGADLTQTAKELTQPKKEKKNLHIAIRKVIQATESSKTFVEFM